LTKTVGIFILQTANLLGTVRDLLAGFAWTPPRGYFPRPRHPGFFFYDGLADGSDDSYPVGPRLRDAGKKTLAELIGLVIVS